MDEVVRAATMAYNESLGKDRTVFSLPVRKIQVGDHVSDLDQPFVDFGRFAASPCQRHVNPDLACVARHRLLFPRPLTALAPSRW